MMSIHVREDLPSGLVTFLFTDIEGSTNALHELGAERYATALDDHRRAVRAAFVHHGGVEVDTQGDAFFVAFTSAPGAVAAAAEAQRALAAGKLRVRMGLHTGEPLRTAEGYVGVDVHRAARIAAAGHGRQVLLSAETRAHVDGEGLRDLGVHRLKDLTAPERIWQLGDERFPPLKTLYRAKLPVPATPFLGRDTELREVVALLEREDARIVTLTGPGGTGKTRLALQAAAEASDAFPGGLTWVPLAPLREPGPVLETIANALDLRAEAGRPLAETLVEHLAGTRCLVLIDNVEHLLPEVASDIATVAAPPGTKVLVTSRERLQLQGEHVWAVPPLVSGDGVELFTARAKALDASFSETPAVAALCDRLDNLPLALELAAARTPLFTPEQLLDRVGERLDLLRGGRDTDPRQHTLRATIAWSYDLLSADEQRLFRALSVFVGGCSYEAAEAICDADPDTLQSLLDKSLVRRRDSELGPRYWMLETILEFAAELSRTADEQDGLHRRHAEWFLAGSEEADAAMRGDAVPCWNPVRWFQEELPNLRAAVDWALDLEEEPLAWRLAAFAGSAWPLTGAVAEGRKLLERSLQGTDPIPPRVHARILQVLGSLEHQHGEIAEAELHLQRAAELFEQDGDDTGVFEARLALVATSLARGDAETARNRLQEARSLARPSRDLDRAQLCRYEADLEGATGGYSRAQTLSEEALTILRETAASRSWFVQLINIAWWAIHAGDLPRARSALEEYLAADEAKTQVGIANAHSNLGLIALYEGRRDDAALHFREQLELARAPGARVTIAEGLYGSAAVAAMDGDRERAVRLWGAADQVKRTMGAPLSKPEADIVERYLQPLLAEADAEQLRTEGAALSTDDAITMALDSPV
jgi:predicted ATPase/class 3 adenylate cyclase